MHQAGGFDYEEHGGGEAVLLIHGGAISEAFAPLLAERALSGYRVIRYRRRGYGGSPPLSSRPTFQEHATDALALLEALGEKRAHVVGHSAGGAVAVQMAVDAPDAVASLVLLEPALHTSAMAATLGGLVAPLVAMHHAGESAKAVHLFMKVATSPGWRAQADRASPGAVRRAEEDAAGLFEGDLAAACEWAFDDAGDHIRQPVLHIVGSRTARRVDPATRLLGDAVPAREEAIIDGADHALPMTHARELADVIAEFLRRHPYLAPPTARARTAVGSRGAPPAPLTARPLTRS